MLDFEDLDEHAAYLTRLTKSANSVVAEQAREALDRLATVDLAKVGPKGYIHGWIFVGALGVGNRVAHPELGHGTVTHHEGGRTHVRFDSGREFQFGHSNSLKPTHGHFAEQHFASEAERAAPKPGELPRGATSMAHLLGKFDKHRPSQEELDQVATYLERAAGLADPHTKLKVEVQQVKGKPKSIKYKDGELHVRWSVYDEGDHGKSYRPVVGMAERGFRRNASGGLDVEHIEFKLDRRVRGGGFASRWSHKAEAMYRANGVDRIVLEANIDVGGYAWAKQGYQFAGPAILSQIAERFERVWKTQKPSSVSRTELQALLDRSTPEHWANGTAPSPVEWAMLGWHEGADTWFGKKALLGSSWLGVKKL